MVLNEVMVGHILVRTEDYLKGLRLERELSNWLTETGWQNLTTVSVEAGPSFSMIELIPGEYQSNGPKKIGINQDATAADITPALHRWLSEIED